MTTFAGLITYYTEATVQEAADFYIAELAALGWTYNEGTSFVAGDGGFMSFTSSSGDELLITLTSEGDRVMVTMVESP